MTTHKATTPSFLVAGTAIAETVEHQPEGGRRTGLGGVAATIAAALAGAGDTVTLITSVGTGPQGEDALRILDRQPFQVMSLRNNSPAGFAHIPTRGGEQRPARGRWPRISGISTLVQNEAQHHDWVITDCNMSHTLLRQLLDQPDRCTMVNGTTTRRATILLDTRDIPKTLVTLNQAEALALMRDTRVSGSQPLMQALNAQHLLITLGPEGWNLYTRDLPDNTVRSQAVPVPDRTDFIGCGDYAAAGAVHAIAHRLDAAHTVNSFITRKLAQNVA